MPKMWQHHRMRWHGEMIGLSCVLVAISCTSFGTASGDPPAPTDGGATDGSTDGSTNGEAGPVKSQVCSAFGSAGCKCLTGTSCSITCSSPQCGVTCESGSTCDVACTAQCDVQCSGTCTVHGAQGVCKEVGAGRCL